MHFYFKKASQLPDPTSVGNCGFGVLLCRLFELNFQVSTHTHVLATFFNAVTDDLPGNSIRGGFLYLLVHLCEEDTLQQGVRQLVTP